MLELNDVTKRYGRKPVIAELSHAFAPGVTVITGPSGAGKSTLLRVCATVERPTSGQVLWNGAALGRRPKAYRLHLGYAPQRIDFPEDISAMDFMLHVASLKALPLGAAREQAMALLGRVGLGADAHRRIVTFSGGMRRRLGLAQAFLGTPEILILDEPTAELDRVTAGHIHDLIFETAERATVLMTTHLDDGLDARGIARLAISPAV